MPFAGLARLGSYVAMFLVLRSAIPALAALPRRSARSVDVFANIIVPFFAIYLAWKLFAEDWLDFETAALNYRIGDAMTRALKTGESSGSASRRAAGQRRHVGHHRLGTRRCVMCSAGSRRACRAG